MFKINEETKKEIFNANSKKLCVIYSIHNLINNKRYIGKSIHVKERINKHYNSYVRKQSVNPHIQCAFEKYGIENFEFTIIEIVDLLEIDEREIFWINFYQSNNSTKGYNKTNGGDSGLLSIETKIKLSNTSPNKKIVYQFNLKGELIKKWDSVHDIKRECGYSPTTISKACKNNSKNITAHGYFWGYNLDISNKTNSLNRNKTKIIQKDLFGNIVKNWDSLQMAYTETKSNKASIIRCCKGQQKTCNGFIWEYL